MKILFCNIAWMKFYKGISENDIPLNGDVYVDEDNDANDSTNFEAVTVNNSDYFSENEKYFLGFLETKKNAHDKQNQLHVEKIQGCEQSSKEDHADEILVVWCAKSLLNEDKIVGWYKNATVFRNYQTAEVTDDNCHTYKKIYNIVAKADDCVLLPEGERNKHIWTAARAQKKGRSYGFGRANIWYAAEESAKEYIENIIKNINKYENENSYITKKHITQF